MTHPALPRIAASFARQSMMQTLGAEIVTVDDGVCELAAPLLPAMGQQHGAGHAGVTFALGDTAAGYAALTLIAPEREVMTAEMKINLLAPAVGVRLIARGRVVRPGRRAGGGYCRGRGRSGGRGTQAGRNSARHDGTGRSAMSAGQLARFHEAQSRVWPEALAELRAGLKQTHWMWFIFPQLASLGRSATAKHYGIADLGEARAYLGDTVRRGHGCVMPRAP